VDGRGRTKWPGHEGPNSACEQRPPGKRKERGPDEKKQTCTKRDKSGGKIFRQGKGPRTPGKIATQRGPFKREGPLDGRESGKSCNIVGLLA